MSRDIESRRWLRRQTASPYYRALVESGRRLADFPTSLVGSTQLAATASDLVSRLRNRGATRVASALATPPRSPRTMSRSRSRGRSMKRGRTSRRRSYSRSRSRSTGSSGILTRQHDQRGTYRSRRGGRRRGRAGYSIQNALCRMEPLQTWTTKTSVNATSNVDQNGMYGIGLFTTNMADQPDLASISSDAGTSASETSRYWIKSACLDVELKNTGDAEIIMDVYTLLLRKDTELTQNMYSLFTTFFNQQTTLVAKNFIDVANTVFQNPMFCKYFKVLSKREVMILPGEISALQMRRGKDKFVPTEQISKNQTGLPGTCKFFFFMWHGPPDPTAGTLGAPAVAATTVTFSSQKSYTYALVPGTRNTIQIHNT